MRSLIFAAIFLPVVACAQGTQRGGRYGGDGQGATTVAAPVPEQVVAPSVPVLAGLPHAIRIGYVVYVSGMVPLDSAGSLVSGDFSAQTRQVVANIGAVMRAARGVAGDVVQVTAYVRDLTPDKVASVRAAILDGLDRSQPPALTVVGVSALTEPGIEVTMDAIGQLRSEFPDRSRMRY